MFCSRGHEKCFSLARNSRWGERQPGRDWGGAVCLHPADPGAHCRTLVCARRRGLSRGGKLGWISRRRARRPSGCGADWRSGGTEGDDDNGVGGIFRLCDAFVLRLVFLLAVCCGNSWRSVDGARRTDSIASRAPGPARVCRWPDFLGGRPWDCRVRHIGAVVTRQGDSQRLGSSSAEYPFRLLCCRGMPGPKHGPSRPPLRRSGIPGDLRNCVRFTSSTASTPLVLSHI